MLIDIKVNTSSRTQFKDITPEVLRAVEKSKVKSGICFVYVTHTTAGITINENADPAVRADMIRKLNELVPQDSSYTHSEGNSDAHIKASMMGFTASIPVEDGELQLGTWQGIYFCEFDGPRTRRVLVKIIADN